MNPFSTAPSSRTARVLLRSEKEREQLLAHLADIEQRLQHADDKLAAVRRFVTQPAVVAGGTLLMLLLRNAGGKWRWASRGLVVATTAWRVFGAFRRR